MTEPHDNSKPLAQFSMQVSLPTTVSDAELLALVRKHFAGVLASRSSQQASIERFGDGMTNRLYRLTFADDAHAPPLLMRLFGQNSELFVDRDRECRLLQALGEPKLHVRFANGYIYDFVCGAPLRVAELRDNVDLQRALARELARWHQTDLLAIVNDHDSDLFETIERWIVVAERHGALERDTSALRAVLHATRARIDAAVATLERNESSVLSAADVAFVKRVALRACICHRDANPGNAIFQAAEQRVVMIDVEYSGIGCAAFELANVFCEFAGLECQFAEFFPSAEQRRTFVAMYIDAVSAPSASVAEPVVDAVAALIDLHVPLSHVLWAVWALTQANVSDLACDFEQYAAKRIAQTRGQQQQQ